MWNVSGITGAAPIWIEMMNWLHPHVPMRKEPSAHLVRQEIQFPRDVAPPREELFIQGTEPNSKDQRAGQFNQRIVYPPSGAVIGLDPDIPPELQKIFFVSHPRGNNLRWVLNDHTIGKASNNFSWSPRTGAYILTLIDENDQKIDSVHFEVRGPSEDEKGTFIN